MVRESQDLLLGSAGKWEELLKHRYIITYGYRNHLYTVTISFYDEDFFHLAGFHYLKDISLPRFNRNKYHRKIIEGKIQYSDIIKSQHYSRDVEPRLKALSHLPSILENDFTLYAYRRELYSFYTQIDADYVIHSDLGAGSFVFFVKADFDKDVENNYLCQSIFEQGHHDFRQNQRVRTVLKKEKLRIEDGVSTVLFNRLPTNND